jgi:hypothetical protein
MSLYAEKTKFEKYSEVVRSRPDIRFISFAVTEFGARCHATAFLAELAMQAAAYKGMHLWKLIASWRRNVSLTVHVAYSDNVLRGLSAAADDVEAAFSSTGMRSLATALIPRAMGRKRLPCSRAALEAPFVASMCCVFHRCVRVSCVLLCFIC